MMLTSRIGEFLSLLGAIGIAYQAIAFFALGRFFARPRLGGAQDLPVTILKPLYGAEPRLRENLESFISQDHHGPIQLLCGVGSPGDAAVAVVEDLQRAYPDADIVLAVNSDRHGTNAKVCNLINMMPSARHDVLVLSDSDMAVGPDYLAGVLGALEQPGVGIVSCLYAGRGDAGLWSEIDAAIVSYSGTPKVVMSLTLGAARPCMGSTIAIRRETLEAVGGFERFRDVLADDYAIGEAVAAKGLKVAIPPMLLTHAGAERSLGELWRHHLRWAVTIRGVAPLRHIGSGIVHALPLGLLAMPFLPLPGLGLVLIALSIRLAVALRMDRFAGRPAAPLRLLPIADCIEFAVYLTSLFARNIDWRGRQLTMTNSGRIADRTPSASDIS